MGLESPSALKMVSGSLSDISEFCSNTSWFYTSFTFSILPRRDQTEQICGSLWQCFMCTFWAG